MLRYMRAAARTAASSANRARVQTAYAASKSPTHQKRVLRPVSAPQMQFGGKPTSYSPADEARCGGRSTSSATGVLTTAAAGLGAAMLDVQAAEAVAAIKAVPVAKRSAWGFFTCSYESNSLMRIGWPTTAADSGMLPQIALARPTERRLAYGPFAFKLSPSSEVLAWLLATRFRKFLVGASVLELGSGLGLTGVVCAAWCEPDSVLLTDGDPKAADAVSKNVELNRAAFGRTAVEAKILLWGAQTLATEGNQARRFDVIISADCVYDRQSHDALCATIRGHMRSNGCTIVVASRRCGSMSDFEACARSNELSVQSLGTDYLGDAATARFRHAKCFPLVYLLRHVPSGSGHGSGRR